MKKILFLTCCIFLTFTFVMGQKLMKVTEYDLGTAVPREAGDNETVVVVRSAIPLEFESTMDKTVDIYNVIEESGFTHYFIKFSTLPKFKGRKLKIKSFGFETHTEPLMLTAKVPLGLLVIDPDGSVGVGCYFMNLNEGNKLFANTLYEDAKTAYFKALECSDIPEDNDLEKKIDDAGDCADSKRNADKFYNNNQWELALREYEKVVGLNVADHYSIGRIEKCEEHIANMPRVITGRVTETSTGQYLEGVIIKAEYEKLDKKGKIEYDKKGNPKTEFKTVGTTDRSGYYKITVLNKSKQLLFLKGTTMDEYQYKAEVTITSDQMDIPLKRIVTTSNVAKKTGKILDRLLK